MPKLDYRSSQKIKKLCLYILKASGFIERDIYYLMKTLLVLNRKLCCGKKDEVFFPFFPSLKFSSPAETRENIIVSPKENSADLPMVDSSRNFKSLRNV